MSTKRFSHSPKLWRTCCNSNISPGDFQHGWTGAIAEGVYRKSWAVPKGPPYIKGEKRLAMATEDHPLAYLDFEGIIPKGQYGGGTVMVWDIGTYALIEGNYYKGFLRMHLTGKKLKGEWILTPSRHDEKNKWYLIKAEETCHPCLHT